MTSTRHASPVGQVCTWVWRLMKSVTYGVNCVLLSSGMYWLTLYFCVHRILLNVYELLPCSKNIFNCSLVYACVVLSTHLDHLQKQSLQWDWSSLVYNSITHEAPSSTVLLALWSLLFALSFFAKSWGGSELLLRPWLQFETLPLLCKKKSLPACTEFRLNKAGDPSWRCGILLPDVALLPLQSPGKIYRWQDMVCMDLSVEISGFLAIVLHWLFQFHGCCVTKLCWYSIPIGLRSGELLHWDSTVPAPKLHHYSGHSGTFRFTSIPCSVFSESGPLPVGSKILMFSL